ncbi:putative lipoprotein [Teredinibacter turnerae T7901]|uniref:Lipoprotein n=1 Tax=Teredinibacter turnerae (strain ATCC 39867 / T7901) TaxID=377629 RepID=C5BLQ4_TERTT|nr:hypothetical protein [Teredinibacter turnerae]ACR12579.1 putative lipoprotein [Teredinibacter turnerae T7901]
MLKSILKLLIVVSVVGVVGCTTSGTFVIPEGSQLYLAGRDTPVDINANGQVRTHGFKWSQIGIPPGGGVSYRLEKDGKTIQEGKLRSKFRPASIFIPIYGVVACPVGLNGDITYDLVNGTQE